MGAVRGVTVAGAGRFPTSTGVMLVGALVLMTAAGLPPASAPAMASTTTVAGARAPLVTVSLVRAAQVSTETVTVGQIASLKGSQSATRLIAKVVIAQAPAPDATGSVTAAQVRRALADAGIDLKAVAVTGAPAVSIKRVSGASNQAQQAAGSGARAGSAAGAGGTAGAGPAAPAGRDSAPAGPTAPARQDGFPGSGSPPVVVPRGSTVQVVAAVGPIRVTTPGVALGSGAEGQVIAVRVLHTRRVVTAVVIGRGLVAVQF